MKSAMSLIITNSCWVCAFLFDGASDWLSGKKQAKQKICHKVNKKPREISGAFCMKSTWRRGGSGKSAWFLRISNSAAGMTEP